MVATADVQEANGAGPAWNTVTNFRMCTTDAYNPLATFPIPIPGAGFNYSYWKSLCLNFTGTFTTINNIRYYTDGSEYTGLGTSGEIRRGNRDAGDDGCPDGSYDQATGTPGTTGDDVETHSYFSAQTTKSVDTFATDVIGTPATVHSADISAPGRSNHMVLQAKIDTDAVLGAKTPETYTFLYDEV